MTLALVIPFRGTLRRTPAYVHHLARLIARLSHFDDPEDRPDLVVVGHTPLWPFDHNLLERDLPKLVRKHPTGRWSVPLEFMVGPGKNRWRPAVARNIGAAHALALGATKLVFMDADILPTRGAFLTAREVLGESPAPSMVQIPWQVTERTAAMLVDQPMWAQLPAAQVTPENEGIYIPGAWFGVSAETFLRCGGFDEDLTRGEDEDLADRAVRAGAPRRFYLSLCVHVGPVTDPRTDPELPRIRAVLDERRERNVIHVPGRFDATSGPPLEERANAPEAR